MEAANSPIFEICWKTAKNAPVHIKSPVKNFLGRAKGGGHRTMPLLNTPLGSGPNIHNNSLVLYSVLMKKPLTCSVCWQKSE